MSCRNGCSLWSRGSWLGGSLVSALSFVASCTLWIGPCCSCRVSLFLFSVWGHSYHGTKLSSCMNWDDTKLSPLALIHLFHPKLVPHVIAWCLVWLWFVCFCVSVCFCLEWFLFVFWLALFRFVFWMIVTAERTMYRSSTSYFCGHPAGTAYVWKFDTLCEHPLGKGEATCHSSLCTNYAQRICGRLLQEVMEDW